jgi:drug/metabolite transporter (DMT)-like permease
VSLVYPVARGTAPVLVLIGAALFLSRGASAGQIAGVVTVGSGIMLVRGLALAPGGSEGRGFALALATGVFIAGYTLVDKQGLEHAGPIAYLELVQLGPALCYASAITRVRGLATVRSELTPRVCVVGVILFGNYLLVLLALRLASAASVSAVRETSVVVASGLAALVTRERVSPVRFVGAVLVAAGIALVALSS